MPNTDELIRQALRDRATTVAADSLRYPTLAARRRAPVLPALAVAATVVAVLAIAIGFYATGRPGRPGGVASGSAALVGTTWRLTEVSTALDTVHPRPLPAGFTGALTLHDDGTFDGRNADNAIAGTYTLHGRSITFHLTTSGAAGSAGPNNGIEAMDSLSSGAGRAGGLPMYNLEGGTLRIRTLDWSLVFRPSTSIVGVHWQLRSVQDSKGTFAIPAAVHASAEFGAGGVLGVDNGGNHLSGHYRLVASGYAVVGPVGGTDVLYDPTDPARRVALAAMTAATNGTHVIRAAASADRLIITAGGYTLVFGNGGAIAPSPATSSTGSAPSHHS